MRILAVSDVDDEAVTASLASKVGTIDLVIGCGDLTYDYLDYVATALGAPLRAVHGNHDVPPENLDDPAIGTWWRGHRSPRSREIGERCSLWRPRGVASVQRRSLPTERVRRLARHTPYGAIAPPQPFTARTFPRCFGHARSASRDPRQKRPRTSWIRCGSHLSSALQTALSTAWARPHLRSAYGYD